MSVIVKGMEMPECCGVCKLSVQVSMSLGAVMRCRLVGDVGTSFSDPYDVFNKRHPACPLVALPDKHGRLVDADACAEYFWEHLDDNGMAGAMNAINDMPTIVEAEDEP